MKMIEPLKSGAITEADIVADFWDDPALFLRRFVERARYRHFDIYGHSPADLPARPKGGAGQGARAILQGLPAMLGF